MSQFGKKTTKRIGVSPKVSRMVKKAEATSFDAWCKRKGMTTKKGKATKACVKKAIASKKRTSEWGGAKRIRRSISERMKEADDLYKRGKDTYEQGKKTLGKATSRRIGTLRDQYMDSGMEQIRDGARDLKRARKLNPIKYAGKVTRFLLSKGRWGFGFDPRRKVARAVSRRMGSTAKKFRQTELRRLSIRTKDTLAKMNKELKPVDKTIEFAKSRGDFKLLQRFKNISNDIKSDYMDLINKDKRKTYKRIIGTFTKGVPKWFK